MSFVSLFYRACSVQAFKNTALIAKPVPLLLLIPMSEIPGEFEEQPIVWSDEAVRISEMFKQEASLQGDS